MTVIRHMLWDLDGVFFKHSDQYQQALHHSLAGFISETHGLDGVEAKAMADLSQAETNSCFGVFIDRYGHEFEFLAEHSYARLDIGFMQTDPQLIDLLANTGTDHAIVTKSSMDWALRVVKQVQLDHLFSEKNIIACAAFPEFSKSANPLAYQYALNIMGFAPEQTLMVEDTQKNLLHAKALGIKTVLVHSTETPLPYTDDVFATPLAFLQDFIAQRQTP